MSADRLTVTIAPAKSWIDPRTKFLIVLVVSGTLMNSPGGNSPLALCLRWGMIAVPVLLFLSYRLVGAAIRYILAFSVLWLFSFGASQLFPDDRFVGLFMGLFGGLLLLIPGLACGNYLLQTTSANEFIAAMQQLRIPRSLTITTSIIFRFFPTVAQEYRDIRTAMKMRGIGGIRGPVEMLEYRLVPLLVSVVGIGNELSMSAVTRALGSDNKRTCLTKVHYGWVDSLILIVIVAVIVANMYLYTS